MIANPTPCRIVLYHFRAITDGETELRSRPAMVTSVGASDDVVNLFVFFEPNDIDESVCDERSRSLMTPHRTAVHPFDPNSKQAPGWSWPPRT